MEIGIERDVIDKEQGSRDLAEFQTVFSAVVSSTPTQLLYNQHRRRQCYCDSFFHCLPVRVHLSNQSRCCRLWHRAGIAAEFAPTMID